MPLPIMVPATMEVACHTFRPRTSSGLCASTFGAVPSVFRSSRLRNAIAVLVKRTEVTAGVQSLFRWTHPSPALCALKDPHSTATVTNARIRMRTARIIDCGVLRKCYADQVKSLSPLNARFAAGRRQAQGAVLFAASTLLLWIAAVPAFASTWTVQAQ